MDPAAARGYYLQEYLLYLSVEKSLARRTLEEYEADLKLFLDSLQPHFDDGLQFAAIDVRTVREFLAYLRREKRYTANAMNRKIACLKGYFRFLEAEGFIASSPMQRISSAKDGRPLPKVLQEEEVETFLQTAETQGEDREDPVLALRDKVILELLYATGIRISELVGLDIGDINWDKGTLRVLGKGNKERYVFFNPVAAEMLGQYLGVRPKTKHSALFLNRFNERLSARAVQIRFAKVLQQSGLTKKASPHTMRHSFATHMLQGGSDLVTIKELLGHENLSTTQIYTNISRTRMKQVYDQAHPRGSASGQ